MKLNMLSLQKSGKNVLPKNPVSKVEKVADKEKKLDVLQEVGALKNSSFITYKAVSQIRGCTSDMDDVSMLCFIAENFLVRPNWEYVEFESFENSATRFLCKIDFSGVLIYQAFGKNKKDAKFNCAKRAICLIAPNVFKYKYPGEPIEKFHDSSESYPDVLNSDLDTLNQILEEKNIPADEILLGDPNLMKRQELFVHFKPYQFIKQVFCDAIHKGKYQVFQH